MLFQILKFGLIGISNTLIDFSAYVFLTRFFGFWSEHFVMANVVAVVVAATWSFFWNKRWTFASKGGDARREYAKFLAVNVLGLCINSGILYALVRFFDAYDLIAKAVGVLAVFFVSFLLHKYWTFRNTVTVERH